MRGVSYETAILFITLHDYNNAENINLSQLHTNNFQTPDDMKTLSVRFIYSRLTIVLNQHNQRHLYLIHDTKHRIRKHDSFLFKIV
jgi:hypothetical protein